MSNNSEMRRLECEEREYEEKLAALRAAIDAGYASGVAGRGSDVMTRIRKELNLPPRKK